jgi:hypothetical protein
MGNTFGSNGSAIGSSRQRRHSTINYEAPLVFETAQAAS